MLDELPASESGDLADTTIGLVGLGAIGRALAERLRSFGAHVVYASRTRETTDVEERLGVSWLPLPDLLQASDIVSLHPPLTAETHRLIGEPELAMMPRGSFLINTARGGLVDEVALRRAIAS